MCFIFKLNQPRLCFTVNRHRYFNGAGINFRTLIKVRNQATLFENFHADYCHIHEGNRTLGIFSVNFITDIIISFQGLFHHAADSTFSNGNFLQAGTECGMAAVVAPISINHAQFRHGWVTMFFFLEIIPHKIEIFKGHGKAHLGIIALHLRIIPFCETRNSFHICRALYLHLQSFRLIHRGNAAFHRINQVLFHTLHVRFRKISLHRNNFCSDHLRAFFLCQKLNTLSRTVGTLVILSGQILYCKCLPAL